MDSSISLGVGRLFAKSKMKAKTPAYRDKIRQLGQRKTFSFQAWAEKRAPNVKSELNMYGGPDGIYTDLSLKPCP